ncbi:LysR family transcriptional regulator [Planobispora rosea]|uniref:LysR family transcriptional regulator n=1 Tax=Planobispora rosea TaxID=35762 RepID=A0A8J3RYN2_PLARO|nr:LysR family transcriptional regulator [Planobispora rosea]GGS82791.1 LysR family transcriptional regulator [Planobispora rosea]GIH84202.1 LysR family transcriptional regulator [Planobispora rosea]
MAMDVHLRELRYFVTVAEELNVTRAAQRLFVSQPALSKQLAALERQLGFPLFDRVHSGMALTRQGEALLPFARELLERWNTGVEAARAAVPSGTLVVGMQTAVGRGLQQEALRRFRTAMPGWEISLRLVSWADPSGGLADGSSDLAFVWLPTAPGLETRVLSVERRFVALPDSHPLAAREEIPFAELRDEPFIALPAEAGPLRDFWLARDARDDDPVIAVTASTADETFEAITSGLGIVLIAEGNASLYKRPGVVYRPVSGLAPAELAVSWRKGDHRPQVRAFLDALPGAAAVPRS